jgi:hypothetical protein
MVRYLCGYGGVRFPTALALHLQLLIANRNANSSMQYSVLCIRIRWMRKQLAAWVRTPDLYYLSKIQINYQKKLSIL